MAITAKYLFVVSMDVEPDKEALFNEVYDEHIGFIRRVPGVRGVSRAKTAPAAVMIGGEKKPLIGEGEPTYTAIYELDSPDVLLSQAWQDAVEAGRWAAQVRPYTKNRHHVLRQVI
ncbi:hypothetical protein [Vineibacter terrae]|uniref:hypothetical protein n=1 Tax=Vineibacter terrae TaxID=2586908 RepID=UPI002E31E93C|nr:hypothetical protein [Vineibacter terrae]HEX2885291.1 hypothetical protein [Vineibacter terrae]